jgi:cytochrome d ubiquinol oxidase subunit I
VSPTIDAPTVLAPLMAFVAVHSIIFGAGTYYLFKLLRRGPDPVEDSEDENVGRAPKRPLSTLAEGLDGSSPCDASPPAE